MTTAKDGPALVWRGDPAYADGGRGGVVIVLDPAGEASHGELPATWRPLTEALRIGWVRLPADGAGVAAADAALAGLPGRSAHLVTSGLGTELALRLAAARASGVRSVFLVDPEPCDGSLAGAASVERSAWWEDADLGVDLADSGVVVRVFHSDGLGIAAPAPLGLPQVVDWVRGAVGGAS